VAAEPESTTAGTVSAVVINYNAASVLADCVVSLRAAGIEDVIVVDNGSTDDSRAVLEAVDPKATWLPSGGNLGYGRAANLGVRSTQSRTLLICNPDVVLGEGSVDALLATLDADPATGIVGPQLLNPDGSVYPSARAFPSLADAIGHGLLGLIWPGNPFSRRYKLLDWDHAESRRVDWVSGACFLIRRRTWDEVGGFDPTYFMFMEDVDLCWRAGRAGWTVLYEPAAEVTHIQGVSTNSMPYRMIVSHHQSLWRFARSTTSGWRRATLPLVGVGLVARSALACLDHWRDGRRRSPGRSARGRRVRPVG
jgi:N-acetylglucosaminyl-diphospho-decaprenol L-rhamnosyltransferase